MTQYTEDEHGMLVEPQGPFAPESLPDTIEDYVFTRRWTGHDILDVAAAPFVIERDGEPTGLYDVQVSVERRDLGDEDGNTSVYEVDMTNYLTLTLDQAIREAREYVETFNPETA